MKSHDGGSGLPGRNRLRVSKQGAPNLPGTSLPLQWMDPMSWRLPSGKALAEFALQSGFLMPLWMSGPMGDGRVKRKKKVEEVPADPGRFRRNTASHTRQG
jgi:hypothetical protein